MRPGEQQQRTKERYVEPVEVWRPSYKGRGVPCGVDEIINDPVCDPVGTWGIKISPTQGPTGWREGR